MARLVHVLLLQLLWGFTESVSDVFVEVGHDALLLCDKVQEGQTHCDLTTWLYWNPKSSKPAAVEFITLGKMNPDSRYKDRFILTENCSLLVKNVQIQDGQQFSCKQYDTSGRDQASEPSTMLSVVSVEEHNDTSKNCYVSTPRRCSTLEVRWFYSEKEITEDHSSIQKHGFLCGANLVYRNSEIYHTLRRDLFTCEIKHGNKIYSYKLKSEATEKPPKGDKDESSSSSSVLTEKPPKGTDTVGNKSDKSDKGESSSSVLTDWWWIILVAVAVVALTLIAVILVKRRRKKDKPRNDNELQPPSVTEPEPEDGVSYASISYAKKNKSTPEPRQSEEETVTYSAVKTPASQDLHALYASVRK